MASQNQNPPASKDAVRPSSYAAAAAAAAGAPSTYSTSSAPPSSDSKPPTSHTGNLGSPIMAGRSGPDAVLNSQRHSGKAKYAQKRVPSTASYGSPVVGPSDSPLIRSASVDTHLNQTGNFYTNQASTPNSAVNSSNSIRLRRTNSNFMDRKSTSRRAMLYSTDDDEPEIEDDHDRELSEAYKSGFLEGRRRRSIIPKRPSHTKLSAPPPSSELSSLSSFSAAQQSSHRSQFLTLDDHLAANHADSLRKKKEEHVGNHHHHSNIGNLIHEIEHDKDKHIPGVHNLEDRFVESIEEQDEDDPGYNSSHTGDGREDWQEGAGREEAHEGNEGEDGEEGEGDNDNDGTTADDNASISSTETFTLRERQDAINITHPFGIRIWKPAVYKKIRSVQRFAEGEIHSGPIREVSWAVWLGNYIWSLTFGIVLLVLCWSGALFLRVFFFWSKSTTIYSRTFFYVGKYLFYPFGICVQLQPDKNYLEEDSGEGTTVEEYQEWQTTETSRLFFTPESISNTQSEHPDGANKPNGHDEHDGASPTRSGTTLSSSHDVQRKLRFFGRGDWNLGRLMFYVWFYALVYPSLFVISLVCWLGVFAVPMGKVTSLLAYHIRRRPLALSFRPASTLQDLSPNKYSSSILLCTYRAAGLKYYKYTIDGTNIFIMNMVIIVPLTIFNYFFLYEYLKVDLFFTQPIFMFCMSLVGIVPLAYFIGQAVASISAQSSMGMGATINAFFSTIVEVFLYCVALSQGKADLVEGSIVGSIFGGILLLPGLSMCFGAIKRKTQRYNPKSAGVSSTMLLFAIIGAFAPTIFYQIYGTYEVRCHDCSEEYIEFMQLAVEENCRRCHFYQAPLTSDSLFSDIIRPFSAICSLLLFVSYVIGLWFTLRTHAAMIWQTPTSSELMTHTQSIQLVSNTSSVPTSLLPIVNPASLNSSSNGKASSTGTKTPKKDGNKDSNKDNNKNTSQSADASPIAVIPVAVGPDAATTDPNLLVAVGADNGGGHDAPNWSRTKSTVILLVATFMYSIIAEVLVDTVDGVLQSVDISEKFVGVTIFALVPNTTEFLNAISFAMNGNIALSMEIGSAYVLQVCLLQIPALVMYSMYVNPILPNITDFMFTLVFPRWDLLMVVFCVFVFSYIYAEGKSNYFKGSILVLSYLVVMVGFYFAGETGEAGISSFSLVSQGKVKFAP